MRSYRVALCLCHVYASKSKSAIVMDLLQFLHVSTPPTTLSGCLSLAQERLLFFIAVSGHRMRGHNCFACHRTEGCCHSIQKEKASECALQTILLLMAEGRRAASGAFQFHETKEMCCRGRRGRRRINPHQSEKSKIYT